MDGVLVTVTAVSLALAIAMGVVLLKVLREEHQRSEARVARLREAANVADPARTAALADAPRPQNVYPLAAFKPEEDDRGAPMFAAHDAPSPWRARIAVAGAGLGLLLAILFTFERNAPSPAPAAAPAAASAAPLELLALRDAQETGALTISGVVLNPREGSRLSRISAAAFLLGPDGAVVGSGRAELDYPTLAPGDESPFVIKIPVSGGVSKYRVGFRGPDGSVVAHVDRRADTAPARDARNSGSVAPWVR